MNQPQNKIQIQKQKAFQKIFSRFSLVIVINFLFLIEF